MSSDSTTTTADTLYSTCVQEFDEEINIFKFIIFLSISLTAISILLYNVVLQHRFQTSPERTARFFYITGGIKVLIGFSLYTFFLPKCPTNCTQYCDGVQAHSIYPMVAVIIGLLWIRRGYNASQYNNYAPATVVGIIDVDDMSKAKLGSSSKASSFV